MSSMSISCLIQVELYLKFFNFQDLQSKSDSWQNNAKICVFSQEFLLKLKVNIHPNKLRLNSGEVCNRTDIISVNCKVLSKIC